MIRIKYPKYTKKENLSCKLTEEDISRIQKLKREGHTLDSLAEMYGVHRDTIFCWVNDRYRIKKLALNRLHHYPQTKARRESHKKFLRRKLKLKPIMRKWLN